MSVVERAWEDRWDFLVRRRNSVWAQESMLKRKWKKSQGLLILVMGKGHGDKWVPGACWSASLVYLESYKAIRDPIWKEIENKSLVKSKAWNQRFTSVFQIYTHTYIQSHTYMSTSIYTQNAQTHTQLYNSTYKYMYIQFIASFDCISLWLFMLVYICNTHILSYWVGLM